ncbi:MAG: hypothetical protein ACFNUL_11770 [Cardiobacterium hominis]|jgi:hypothetical protein|uniref:hypothetical protein n=1 Tax=Cardiobacterium hominis TaxID=2718 RepID=UPI002492972B|nr:hypothetical protein [Cardiobacterium hominis]
MTKIFLLFVIYISKVIGTWEKPFKQKILLLILTCAIAYPLLMYLPDAKGAKNNPLMAVFILAGFILLPATFAHLLKFHPNKEFKLKFWKKTEKE